jgi:hypothetical protein
VNWNLLASIEQYESKSLTNGTGSEFADGMADHLKGMVKSTTTVGLMQVSRGAAAVALREDPSIPERTGYGWLDSARNSDNLWDESGDDKNLSLHLGAAYLKSVERSVRRGLDDAGVSVVAGTGGNGGSDVVMLSSLVAQAYNGGPGRAVTPFFNGGWNITRVGGEYSTYGLVATERMQSRVGEDDRRHR